jgi:threonine aldolase
MAVTITQATEAGTAYTLDEIAALSDVAKKAACRCTWTARVLPTR